MNCEYPCPICDPEDWAEDNKPPAYDFDGKYQQNLDRFNSTYVSDIPWWTLLTPWPEDIEFITETDDVNVWESNRRIRVDTRRYMSTGELEWWPVVSYRTRVDWEKNLTWIDAVQMYSPPSWGWWMPTL